MNSPVRYESPPTRSTHTHRAHPRRPRSEAILTHSIQVAYIPLTEAEKSLSLRPVFNLMSLNTKLPINSCLASSP